MDYIVFIKYAELHSTEKNELQEEIMALQGEKERGSQAPSLPHQRTPVLDQ